MERNQYYKICTQKKWLTESYDKFTMLDKMNGMASFIKCVSEIMK
jgi:hypothetical protein